MFDVESDLDESRYDELMAWAGVTEGSPDFEGKEKPHSLQKSDSDSVHDDAETGPNGLGSAGA